MIFVDTVRKYQEQMKIDMAIEKTVDECIRNGILEDFLKRNKAEVLRMSIFEYDQETHMKQEREESQAIGAEMKAQSMAIELFKAGVSVETIANAAKVNLETVQQWLAMNEDSVDIK